MNYIGLSYEYKCEEHGFIKPFIVFKSLRYIHLCPICDKKVNKEYISAKEVQ